MQEIINEEDMNQPNKPSNQFLKIVGIVLLVSFGILIYILYSNREKITQDVKDTSTISGVIKPTPMPFEEITIPALREREYDSNLGERTQYLQNGTFTSYVTNYDSDGLRVNGLLTIPNGEKPVGGWPAIVFVHGYIPPFQYKTTEKYVDYVNYLAQSGFVVFKIDLRGHGDSEGAAGGGYYGADYVIDTLNARAALQKADFVNPQKIGLWGHSMAGNAVMRSLAVKPEIPAAVIWAGAVYTYEDMAKYRINDTSYQRPPEGTQPTRSRQQIRDEYGDPDLTIPFWKQMAPVTYLSDLQGAVQLNHAVNDDVVNIGYSRDLAMYLKEEDIPYELHEYPSGGHNITGASFNAAMANTVKFFNTYLQTGI